MAVVPLPIKQSSTMSFSSDKSLIIRVGNSSGNLASWSSFALTDGNCQTPREPQFFHSSLDKRFLSYL